MQYVNLLSLILWFVIFVSLLKIIGYIKYLCLINHFMFHNYLKVEAALSQPLAAVDSDHVVFNEVLYNLFIPDKKMSI